MEGIGLREDVCRKCFGNKLMNGLGFDDIRKIMQRRYTEPICMVSYFVRLGAGQSLYPLPEVPPKNCQYIMEHLVLTDGT